MRAAVLESHGEPLRIADVEAPSAAPRGAVVAVEACGICRSDWHAWMGHGEWNDDRVEPGQILGHEPAGRVVATGERVDSLAVGDRVAVPFCLGEGTCRRCLNGQGNLCRDGWALGFEPTAQGAFAERVHVPRADYNAVPLPASVTPQDVAALGCRYATAYHAIAHRADVAGGDWVAVHGCGGLGLAAVGIATALGASAVAVDVRDSALDRARRVGAGATVDASECEDVPAAVRRETDGEGVHVSVDALGRAETARNSVHSLRPRGTHLQVGLTTDAERGEIRFPTDYVARWDLSILGSRGMAPSRYDELLRMISAGRLDPGALVSRTVGLDDVSDRLAAMTDYGTDGVEVVTSF
jgi:alcohol dehydrogenase